jgi:hypothetical protein
MIIPRMKPSLCPACEVKVHSSGDAVALGPGVVRYPASPYTYLL